MKRTIKDIPNLENVRVFLRVDFNVPIDDAGNIKDETRIVATLPTLKYLLERKAKVIIASHLGRPKGKVVKKYSLKPVRDRLSELLGLEVKFASSCVGEEPRKQSLSLLGGEVLLLENLRFHEGEEKNDEDFSHQLASLADIFIQDAFAVAHRKHASVSFLPKLLPSYAGFLLEKECSYLERIMKNPVKPFVAIIGGAKVSDKIPIIENLLDKINALIIGGGMSYTFLKSKGIKVGNSIVDKEKIEIALDTLNKAIKGGVNVFLPIDHIIADRISPDSNYKSTMDVDIPDGWIGVDISENTIARISSIILNAKTIIWNGPMGVFEIEPFSKGTMKVAEFVAKATQSGCISVIGGGDTVSAIKKMGYDGRFSHVSTGGGATLEFLQGKSLPGLEALPDR